MDNESAEQEVIEDVLQYCRQQGLDFELIYQGPDFKPYALPQCNLIIINMNWQPHRQLPFAILHEFAHVKKEACPAPFTLHLVANRLSAESQADLFAIKWLYQYSLARGQRFKCLYQFLEVYGTPARVYKEFENTRLNALTIQY